MSDFVANIRVCRVCGVPISAARLKVLPNTDTCPRHSMEEKRTDVQPDGADEEEHRRSVVGDGTDD